MATLDDIAKKLGTTKGTVSKALNGADDVSEAMRKAVLETAVELGYSKISRVEYKKKICIFIENMNYTENEAFGHDIVTGFRKAAEPAGFQVDIIQISPAIEAAHHYDEYMLLHNYIGGLFLGLTLTDIWMEDFKTCRTPAILYDNQVKNNPHVTSLGIDNDEGMELAVHRLKELGHKRIGYLSYALGSYINQIRYKAFFNALKKNDLEANAHFTGYSYYTAECLEKRLPRLLDAGCTAVICCNDILAHSVILHCKEKGMSIPDDLSIVGFDDIPMCQYVTPALSSVRQDRSELGKSAFYAITTQINNVPISSLLLHPAFIERASIGEAPREF